MRDAADRGETDAPGRCLRAAVKWADATVIAFVAALGASAADPLPEVGGGADASCEFTGVIEANAAMIAFLAPCGRPVAGLKVVTASGAVMISMAAVKAASRCPQGKALADPSSSTRVTRR